MATRTMTAREWWDEHPSLPIFSMPDCEELWDIDEVDKALADGKSLLGSYCERLTLNPDDVSNLLLYSDFAYDGYYVSDDAWHAIKLFCEQFDCEYGEDVFDIDGSVVIESRG